MTTMAAPMAASPSHGDGGSSHVHPRDSGGHYNLQVSYNNGFGIFRDKNGASPPTPGRASSSYGEAYSASKDKDRANAYGQKATFSQSLRRENTSHHTLALSLRASSGGYANGMVSSASCGYSNGDSPPQPTMKFTNGGDPVDGVSVQKRAGRSPARRFVGGGTPSLGPGSRGAWELPTPKGSTGLDSNNYSTSMGHRRSPHMSDMWPSSSPMADRVSPKAVHENTRAVTAKLRQVEAERREAKVAAKLLKKRARALVMTSAKSAKENDQLRRELTALREELRNASHAPRSSAASGASMSVFSDDDDDDDDDEDDDYDVSRQLDAALTTPVSANRGFGVNSQQRANSRRTSRDYTISQTTPAPSSMSASDANGERSNGKLQKLKDEVRALRDELSCSRRRYRDIYQKKTTLEAEFKHRNRDRATSDDGVRCESPRRRAHRIVQGWDTSMVDPPALSPRAVDSFDYRAGKAIGTALRFVLGASCSACLCLGTIALMYECAMYA